MKAAWMRKMYLLALMVLTLSMFSGSSDSTSGGTSTSAQE